MSPPPLAPADIHLYLHGNGAITLIPADGRSRFVTLAEAVDAAQASHRAGGRLHLGGDNTELSRSARDRLVESGVGIVPDDAPAPMAWGEGTTALISAAAFGRDAILDDLIERGVDVHAVDDGGATALHHAAGAGNLHAIDALVAAGVDPDQTDHNGMRAIDIARARQESAAVARLEVLGADTGIGAAGEIRFRRSHWWVVAIWPILLVAALTIVTAVLWPIGGVDIALLAAALVLMLRVPPPRLFWAGAVPRSLQGSTLVATRILGGTVTVDLADVRLAGAGGSTGPVGYRGSRWLILAHPSGRPPSRVRELKRLAVPTSEEIQALMDSGSPLLVLPLDGYHRDEVILPVGNILTTTGATILPAFAMQVNRARREAAERANGRKPSRLRRR